MELHIILVLVIVSVSFNCLNVIITFSNHGNQSNADRINKVTLDMKTTTANMKDALKKDAGDKR